MIDRRRGRRIGLGLVAIVLLGVVAVFGLRSQSAPRGGRAAPQLPRERLLGGPLTLSGLISSGHGRPSLVIFWASWCGPCKDEAPEVERFARTSQGSGRIVGVNWSDARPGAKAFLAKYHWSFPNLRDGDGSVGNDYELTVLPTTFVINGKGRITGTLRGPQSVSTLHAAMSGAEAN